MNQILAALVVNIHLVRQRVVHRTDVWARHWPRHRIEMCVFESGDVWLPLTRDDAANRCYEELRLFATRVLVTDRIHADSIDRGGQNH